MGNHNTVTEFGERGRLGIRTKDVGIPYIRNLVRCVPHLPLPYPQHLREFLISHGARWKCFFYVH